MKKRRKVSKIAEITDNRPFPGGSAVAIDGQKNALKMPVKTPKIAYFRLNVPLRPNSVQTMIPRGMRGGLEPADIGSVSTPKSHEKGDKVRKKTRKKAENHEKCQNRRGRICAKPGHRELPFLTEKFRLKTSKERLKIPKSHNFLKNSQFLAIAWNAVLPSPAGCGTEHGR